MKITSKSLKKQYPYLRTSLLTVLLVVLLNTLFFTADRQQGPMHGGAPTYTVCHAIPREEKAGVNQGRGDRYFCSNDGCYSDDYEEMSVIGSYEDANMCAGIAENLNK